MDVRVNRPDGEQRWVTAYGERIQQQDTYLVRGYIRDVTEDKQYERELEAQNERLKEPASIVSHDLQNPLGVADGYLELAQEECESEHLRAASDAVQRSRALVDGLLALARGRDDVGNLEAVRLAEVAETSWQRIDTEQATLKIDSTRAVEADRSRLQQLFETLYRNSVEHAGTGSQPTDDAVSGAVTVRVGGMDGGFYVADTGPGVPEAHRERVFKAGHSTTEDGTGFGLRVVKQVADAHDWRVTLTESD